MNAIEFEIWTDLMVECEDGKLTINAMDKSWYLLGNE